MKRTDRESGKFSRPFFFFCAGIFQQGILGFREDGIRQGCGAAAFGEIRQNTDKIRQTKNLWAKSAPQE